jgi:CcmD family protein
MDDATTFFLAFAAVFLGIALLLLHLERRAKALEARLATLESGRPGVAGGAGGGPATAKAKGPAGDGRPKA